MRQFVTSCTGASQTLTPTIDEKVKVYDDYATACACIACLAEGEIVATKTDNPLDMSTVKEYIADQVTLSDQESISFPYTACYDGYVTVLSRLRSGGYLYFTVTDSSGCAVQYGSSSEADGGGKISSTITVPINKGDSIAWTGSQSFHAFSIYARLYCDRDYTGR